MEVFKPRTLSRHAQSTISFSAIFHQMMASDFAFMFPEFIRLDTSALRNKELIAISFSAGGTWRNTLLGLYWE